MKDESEVLVWETESVKQQFNEMEKNEGYAVWGLE